MSEDVAVAKGYPTTQEKSEVVGETKLTILTKKKQYQVGEEVRVIHVLEVVKPGHKVFITGPKPIARSLRNFPSGRLLRICAGEPEC